MNMEQTTTQQPTVPTSNANVWEAPARTSSAPTSVVSSQPEPGQREHFTSVAPTRSSAPEPKPTKKKAVRKRKAAAAKPVEAEPERRQPAAKPQKETFQEEEDFSDFSF
jgi:hypothetical protein